MNTFKPTAEQAQALLTFKALHGRKWRAELESRFHNGWRYGESSETYSGLLQQVRNTAGGIAWAFKR